MEPRRPSLDDVFSPRGIAVVGASPTGRGFATGVLMSLQRVGFPAVYAVNPKYTDVFGTPCYPSVRDIPGVVTVIIVPESEEAKPMPSEGMMKTVCEHLNKHRLLTSEVYVIPAQYVKIKVEAEVIVGPEADSMATKKELLENLNKFFHPLKGGLDNKGWPFGGDIYYSDVYKVILGTKGVERVETVEIYKDDKKQDTCKNVGIPRNRLLYSNGHELDVHYERV